MSRLVEIASLLKEQSQRIDQLVSVAKAKRDALLERDREEIERLTHEEASLLGEVDRLEGSRADLMVRWTSDTELGSDVTLKSILDTLPAKNAKPLRQIADTLNERLLELDEINRQNASLLYHSLAYVKTVLSTLTDPDPKGKIYGPGKREQSPDSKAILDWRA